MCLNILSDSSQTNVGVTFKILNSNQIKIFDLRKFHSLFSRDCSMTNLRSTLHRALLAINWTLSQSLWPPTSRAGWFAGIRRTRCSFIQSCLEVQFEQLNVSGFCGSVRFFGSWKFQLETFNLKHSNMGSNRSKKTFSSAVMARFRKRPFKLLSLDTKPCLMSPWWVFQALSFYFTSGICKFETAACSIFLSLVKPSRRLVFVFIVFYFSSVKIFQHSEDLAVLLIWFGPNYSRSI